ncbi:hypothetical protein HKCCE4037_08485 [Rhodobacterales bacterium HKCCE4037]|nr:hypothetical protein [Rhodobacterales bacterium HKCCE4037]
MLSPQVADSLIAWLMLGGIVVAGLVALLYVRRRMGREDWADAGSFDGPRRMRFFRIHGVRLLILLALLFAWFMAVGLVLAPLIESVTTPRGQAAEAAQSQ